MRIGCQTVTWGRCIDDLNHVLETIADCGYQGVEFSQSPENIFVRDVKSAGGRRQVTDAQEMLDLCSANGRNLTLLGIGGRDWRQRRDFLADIRPEYLIVDDWDSGAAEATALPKPFRLALHPHWLTPVCRAVEARTLIEEHNVFDSDGKPLLGLAADTGHLTVVDDDPVSIVQEFESIRRLFVVHLKDWTPCVGRYSRRYLQGFVPLGKGIVRLGKVLSKLQDLRYSGWVVVEQDCSETTPERAVMANAQWMTANGWMSPVARLHIPQGTPGRETAELPAPARSTEANGELHLLQSILPTATRSPTQFYQSVVNFFCNIDGIVAATLFSNCERSGLLHLLAVGGSSECHSRKVLKTSACLCGRVVRTQKVTSFNLLDPAVADEFAEPQMLARLSPQVMLTVPIFGPSNPHHLLYLINVFLSRESQTFDGPDLTNLAAHIGRVSGLLVDEVCATVSLQTSHACGRSKTLKEFLEQLVELVQHAFNCEAVSIFAPSTESVGDTVGFG